VKKRGEQSEEERREEIGKEEKPESIKMVIKVLFVCHSCTEREKKIKKKKPELT